mgnify:CR=1 FL=1
MMKPCTLRNAPTPTHATREPTPAAMTRPAHRARPKCAEEQGTGRQGRLSLEAGRSPGKPRGAPHTCDTGVQTRLHRPMLFLMRAWVGCGDLGAEGAPTVRPQRGRRGRTRPAGASPSARPSRRTQRTAPPRASRAATCAREGTAAVSSEDVFARSSSLREKGRCSSGTRSASAFGAPRPASSATRSGMDSHS